MLALEGVRILDLTRQGPGPFCTMILGDLGAEVIKIEAPPAVGARKTGLHHSPTGEAATREAIYDASNRNKKSVGINLATAEGRHIFYHLAEGGDIIIEGFRPGVAKSLSIDYQTMVKINRKIIYCSISGYGQDGPYHDLSGHDINYIAMGGALDQIGEEDRQPAIPLNLLADLGGGGKDAVIGILIALIAREKTGKGQYIDISLTDSVISLLTVFATEYFRYGVVPKRGQTILSGAYPYYSIYKTKDGRFITIGCMEPWLWANLCREIGKAELTPFHFEAEHRRGKAKNKQWEEMSSELKQIFLTKSRDEWFELLRTKDIPIGKVYSLDEVFADPQVLHRKMVVEVEHPIEGKVKQVGIAIKLSDTPGEIRHPSPILGQHTVEVLTGLGYSEQRIAELRQEGVII